MLYGPLISVRIRRHAVKIHWTDLELEEFWSLTDVERPQRHEEKPVAGHAPIRTNWSMHLAR